MRLKSILRGAAASTILLGGFAAPAVAQDDAAAAQPSPAEASDDSEEVVVTAQRREQRLQNVPIAVTALSSETLAEAGLVETLDLGKITPSLLTVQGSGFYVPYIRGIGSRAITPGNESTVATYVDGVYQTDKQGLLMSGFSDVRAIEVLRGPQGTLFGRNATAGAVLVTTRGPSDELTVSLEGTYGSDEHGARVFIAGPITEGISASIAGFYRHQDEYIENLNPANGLGDETGDAEGYGVRGKIRFDLSENFSATLAADYVQNEDTGPWAVQAIRGTGPTLGEGVAAARGIAIPDIRNRRPVYAGETPPLIKFEGFGASLTLDWALDSFDIKSITAYRTDKTSGLLDLDGTPLPLFYFRTGLKSKVWQQELNFSSNTDGPFNWMFGVYYLDMEDGYEVLDQNAGVPYPYSPALLATLPAGAAHIDQFSYVSIQSLGIFGEIGYDFTEKTSITLGLRYTDEEHEIDPRNYSETSIPNGSGGVTVLPRQTPQQRCAADPTCEGLSKGFEEFTYRIVLNHQFTDDILGYVSYNRGFKSGVYNISTATNYLPTEPEIVDAYEIGLKSQLMDRRLTLNAAIYYNDYDDLQVPVTTTSNTQISINAAKARISGLELEARFRATDDLTLSAGFSTFFESKYVSFPACGIYLENPNGGNIPYAGDCSGVDLPGTPDYSFNVGFNWDIHMEGGSTVVLNGLYAYQDEFDYAPYDSELTRAPVQAPIHTINLSATWRDPSDRFHVTAWGRDLVDQDDVFRGLFTTAFGYTTTFSRGATYGVTVGYDF